jgi:hypothetical protein
VRKPQDSQDVRKKSIIIRNNLLCRIISVVLRFQSGTALKDTLYSLVLNIGYVHYQKRGANGHMQRNVFACKQITLN